METEKITISDETRRNVRREIKEAIMSSPTVKKLIIPCATIDDIGMAGKDITKRLSWLN